MGGDLRAGGRRGSGRLAGQELRPRGQGPRRSRGDGRDLLQRGAHTAPGRHRQIPGLGHFHRQRRLRRPRGTHRPDRLGVRLDARPDHRHANPGPRHPHRRRRRRRYRRDLQRAARRRGLRHRAAAGLHHRPQPARGRRDGGRRHLCQPDAARPSPVLLRPVPGDARVLPGTRRWNCWRSSPSAR